MHAEDEKAEEDGDTHQRDGGRCREELPIVDAEVPHHRQEHHEHGHHQAAGAEGQTRRAEAGAEPRVGPGPLGAVLRVVGGLVLGRRLGHVAVEHAVVRDVEGDEGAARVLKELALPDELDLALATREVFTSEKKERENT